MNYIYTEEGKTLYKKYIDIISRLYYGEIKHTNFMYPNEISLVKGILNKNNIYYHVFKSHPNAERVVLFFSLNQFILDEKLLKEINTITIDQYNHTLNHRDILGALMSLGIERYLVGDIIISENKIEITIINSISEYICLNLKSIKHLNIKAKLKSSPFINEALIKFEDSNYIVSSLRLDAVVSAIGKFSRTKAKELIVKGLVKYDYILADDPKLTIKPGSAITIKGKGKFFFIKIEGETRKSNLIIKMRHLI